MFERQVLVPLVVVGNYNAVKTLRWTGWAKIGSPRNDGSLLCLPRDPGSLKVMSQNGDPPLVHDLRYVGE